MLWQNIMNCSSPRNGRFFEKIRLKNGTILVEIIIAFCTKFEKVKGFLHFFCSSLQNVYNGEGFSAKMSNLNRRKEVKTLPFRLLGRGVIT